MSFSPRSKADIEASLSVAVAPSANGRHLVRYTAPEKPYFHLGDTAWELLHRLDRKEAEYFLRNRAAKGFTGVMIVLLAEHGGLDYPNRNGDWPFFPKEDSDSSSSYTPDLLRPNPAYFAFLDSLIPLAASLGITLWLTPTWGRYVNGGYYGSPILFDEQTAHAFGAFLGQRYPFHPFIIGGDSNRYWNEGTMAHMSAGKPLKDLPVKDFGPVYEAMAKGVIEAETKAKAALQLPGTEAYKTFMTFHSAQVWLPDTAHPSSSAQFPDADWISLDVVQTGHHDSAPPQEKPTVTDDGDATPQAGAHNMPMWFARSSYVPVREMYDTLDRHGKPRPVMDLEAHYENTHHFFSYDAPIWKARDIRSGGWQAVFAGACGYTYGCNSIWQMHSASSKSHPPIAMPTTAYTDWYLELDLEGAFQVSIMRKVMESLPGYYDRVPDQSLIVSPVIKEQGDRPIGDKLVGAMRSKTWLAVHLPHGGEVEVRFPQEIISDHWRAAWLDPRTGACETFKRETKATATLKARSPTEGSIDEDWILLVQRDDLFA